MVSREVKIINNIGLHARPATFFIQRANSFNSCNVWVEKDDRKVNAKSLLGVLSLGVLNGEKVRISADGVDEKLAVDTLVELITSGLQSY